MSARTIINSITHHVARYLFRLLSLHCLSWLYIISVMIILLLNASIFVRNMFYTSGNYRTAENPAGSSTSSPDIHHHRKSNSLDAGNRAKTGVQTVHELFRCEIPYPPNSEYELELQKDDLIYVHKKREDGWYKGTLQRTGRTGLFPASFVKPAWNRLRCLKFILERRSSSRMVPAKGSKP